MYFRCVSIDFQMLLPALFLTSSHRWLDAALIPGEPEKNFPLLKFIASGVLHRFD